MEGKAGLQILRPLSDNSNVASVRPSIDVIFIHGLRADPIRNWDKDGFVWIRDALPTALPTARVMTFGYNANVFGDTSRGRIRDFALQLLAALKAKRMEDDERERPLILVGHSLGGLVAKHAMVTANINKEFASLKMCCYGIIFMATPHRGSNKASMGKLLANIAKVSLTRPKNQLLHELEADSLLLQDLSDDFSHLHSQFRMASFFEQKETRISTFTPNIMIVERYSAKMGIEDEMLRPMDADHSSICKFKDADDPLYNSVLSVLEDMIGDAGRVISLLLLESRSRVPTLANAKKALFLQPFDQDHQFVGREDVIDSIDRNLTNKQRVALTGIGGVGKSQIAIEYSYRFREKRPDANIFWVYASTVDRFDQAYKDIARKLRLPGCDDRNTNTLKQVSEWLSDEDHGTWLMIVDNADNSDDFLQQPMSLEKYLPKSSKGFVIITTRDARLGKNLADEESIVVLPFVPQEAECLLRSKLPQHLKWHNAETTDLVETLEYFPLAITQAAAFVGANGTTLQDYIKTLRVSEEDMMDLFREDLYDPRRDLDAPKSVALTWKVSFDQIQKEKPRAADLLSLMAVLDRHGVPKSLLQRDDERRTELTTAIGTLRAFSFITANKAGDTFEMHRLQQVLTRNRLKFEGTKEKFQEEALELLSRKFLKGEPENWKTCEPLFPHAQVVLTYLYISDSSLLKHAGLSYNIAWYEFEKGQYETAHRLSQQAFDTRQNLLGENDPLVLHSLGLLIMTLHSCGKFKEAEKMGRGALEQALKTLHSGHPDTLAIADGLSRVLRDQGKYGEAEKAMLEILKARESSLGREHPETLSVVLNLVATLNFQGMFERAEKMSRRAVEGFEKVLGLEHPRTLDSVVMLAESLRYQARYREAEEEILRAIDGFVVVLGPEHVSTLIATAYLAQNLVSQGKYNQAEVIIQQAAKGIEKALGPEHPMTLTLTQNYITVLCGQDKYDEADTMSRLVLEGLESTLGWEHPNTLASATNRALLLQNFGKNDEAENMCQRALKGLEKLVESQHPMTTSQQHPTIASQHLMVASQNPMLLQSAYGLAMVFHLQGKHEDAAKMTRRALEGFEETLGPEHPDTLVVVALLASVLEAQSKYDEAEEKYRRAVEGMDRAWGPEHPITLINTHDLASLLRDQSKYEEAEAKCQQAVKGREKTLGPEHPDTLTSIDLLASVLRNQNKYEEAEVMYRQAAEGREQTLERDHPDTLKSMNNVMLMLWEMKKLEAAEGCGRQVLERRERTLGLEHVDTLTSVSNMAFVLRYQGKHEEAEVMYRRAVKGREKFGVEHVNTITAVHDLASALQDQGKYNEAEEWYRRAVEGRKTALGPEHPDTLMSVDSLVLVLGKQGKNEEAKMAKRTLNGEKSSPSEKPRRWLLVPLIGHTLLTRGKMKILGSGHPSTLQSINNLTSRLESQGWGSMAEGLHQIVQEEKKKGAGPVGPHQPDPAEVEK